MTSLASAPAGSASSPSIHPTLRSHPRYSAQGSAKCGAMTETLRIRRATVDDMEAIIDDLIDDARAWLPSKGTDQWARPWPTGGRDARVLRDLKAGRTWLVEDGDAPVATVTCNDKGNRRLWTPEEQLVRRRLYRPAYRPAQPCAGRKGLARPLVSWAGARGVRCWSAQWIRIDVWTTNEACITTMKNGAFSTTRYASSKRSTTPRPPSSRSPQQRSTRNRRPGSVEPVLVVGSRSGSAGRGPSTTGGDRLCFPADRPDP